MNTPEQRKERYRQLSENVQWFYSSPEAGAKMWSTAQSIGMNDDEKYTAYAITVGDVLLGLEKKENLLVNLKNQLDISEDDANKLISNLADFLKNAEVALNDWKENIDAQSKKLDAGVENTLNSASYNVKPLRTMDGDAKNIHGYGAFRAPAAEDEPVHSSSQESVMKKESGNNDPSTSPAN